MPGVQQHFI
jgi:1,4-dihydroxy-2-naphthoyl-CoA synthase